MSRRPRARVTSASAEISGSLGRSPRRRHITGVAPPRICLITVAVGGTTGPWRYSQCASGPVGLSTLTHLAVQRRDVDCTSVPCTTRYELPDGLCTSYHAIDTSLRPRRKPRPGRSDVSPLRRAGPARGELDIGAARACPRCASSSTRHARAHARARARAWPAADPRSAWAPACSAGEAGCAWPELALAAAAAGHASCLDLAPPGHPRHAPRHLERLAATERRQPADGAVAHLRPLHGWRDRGCRARGRRAVHHATRRHHRPRAEVGRRSRPREARPTILHVATGARPRRRTTHTHSRTRLSLSQTGALSTIGLGSLVFFDDYSSILIVGNSLRPLLAAVRMSAAKFGKWPPAPCLGAIALPGRVPHCSRLELALRTLHSVCRARDGHVPRVARTHLLVGWPRDWLRVSALLSAWRHMGVSRPLRRTDAGALH